LFNAFQVKTVIEGRRGGAASKHTQLIFKDWQLLREKEKAIN